MSLILSIPFNNSTKNIGLQKNTLTSVPSVTPSYIAGPINNALSFNGSTYWKSQNITLGAEATICCWSKTGTNQKMSWVLESDASNLLNLYELTIYTLNTGDSNDNPFQTDTNSNINVLHDNAWHHFAVTFGDGVAKLYIDGTYRGKAITFRNPTTTNKPIKIGGGYRNAHSYDWNGGIADFRVYDHCLTAYDILRIFNGDTKMLQVSLPFTKDHRNVGLENVKTTSAGTFQMALDTTIFNCAKFGASTGYVKIPHEIFKKNTEMSMTFSINFNSWNTSWATPIGIFKNSNAWTGNTFTFLRNNTGQTFLFNISDGDSSTQTNLKTGNLSLNTWYNFACTYKDKKMSLYQDGSLTGTYTSSFDPSLTDATLAIVGASTTGGGYQTDCKMSNVRFYNFALTEEDINRIYQNEEIIILPSEYEKLEYIKSTGTQWIDTLYVPNANSCVYLKFKEEAIVNNTTYYPITCVRGNDNKLYLECFVKGENAWAYSVAGSEYTGNLSSVLSMTEVEMSLTQFKVNGSVIRTASTITVSNTDRKLFIFAYNKSGTPDTTRYMSCNLYEFKCWENINNNKVFKLYLIPTKRKSDNVIGMYDMISRQFFTNSGTGSFTGA